MADLELPELPVVVRCQKCQTAYNPELFFALCPHKGDPKKMSQALAKMGALRRDRHFPAIDEDKGEKRLVLRDSKGKIQIVGVTTMVTPPAEMVLKMGKKHGKVPRRKTLCILKYVGARMILYQEMD